MAMEQIWWQNSDHRRRFIQCVRSTRWWQDVDVEGRPEAFIRDYTDYGLFFYVFSAVGKRWRSAWIAPETVGGETYDVLNGRQLLADAGEWSSGERALVRLALCLLDHEQYPATLYDCLDALRGAFMQVARVAIAWRFGQGQEPYWASSSHLSDYYDWMMLQYPHHKEPAVRAVIYVLAALDKATVVKPCLVKFVQPVPDVDPLRGPMPAAATVKSEGTMLQEFEGGLVTGAGRYDYRKLQTDPAWFGFSKGERALARLANYLQTLDPQTNLTEILAELDDSQLHVATDALRIRFGAKLEE